MPFDTPQFGFTVASRATPLKPFSAQVFDDAVKAGLGWARLEGEVQWDHVTLPFSGLLTSTSAVTHLIAQAPPALSVKAPSEPEPASLFAGCF